MKFVSVFACLLPICVQAAGSVRAESVFKELIFIDHENLRYVEDDGLTRFQVGEIKRNLDETAARGVGGYLLFAKETMEAMLTYDFEVEGIGHIGKLAFPPDCEHRREAERLRSALRDAIDYAERKNIKLYFHSNQFIFPDEVLHVVKPAVWGTAVCPGRDATWELYKGKIGEFCSMFPELAGLQITGDETQVSVLSCDCDRCGAIDYPERVLMLTNATADALNPFGMEAQMRTWQRMGELGHPGGMERGIRDNVFFSIKNTDGDFRLEHGLDEAFLSAAAPGRLLCEFDAWREYTGHNYFPCYMGSAWAPRFEFLAERGIPRLGVRLMWNSNKNPIFDKPWGNYINIYAFLRLSENPHLNGQEILRMFVDEHYPPEARQAAADLYNFSTEFHKTMYYIDGKHYNADHGRVQDEDAEGDLEDAQEEGFLTDRGDFETRRQRIENAYNHAIQLVDRLGGEVPAEWRRDLKRGARVLRDTALSSADKVEMYFLIQKRMSGENATEAMEAVIERMKKRAEEWNERDPDSFDDMQGADVFEHWTDKAD